MLVSNIISDFILQSDLPYRPGSKPDFDNKNRHTYLDFPDVMHGKVLQPSQLCQHDTLPNSKTSPETQTAIFNF